MFLPFSVYASGYGNQEDIDIDIINTTNEYITNEYITHEYSEVVNQYSIPECTGSASSIASSQIDNEFDTNTLQWGVGVGYYDNCTGIAIGLSKKINKVLLSGTLTKDNKSIGIGIGINGRF